MTFVPPKLLHRNWFWNCLDDWEYLCHKLLQIWFWNCLDDGEYLCHKLLQIWDVFHLSWSQSGAFLIHDLAPFV